jgi:hypothetical protein
MYVCVCVCVCMCVCVCVCVWAAHACFCGVEKGDGSAEEEGEEASCASKSTRSSFIGALALGHRYVFISSSTRPHTCLIEP